MRFIEYPDREMMMIELAGIIAEELATALDHQDSVTLAVPGGTTPGPIFDALSAVDLDWSRVSVMLGDERWVPESSDRSNTALLRARLLQDKAAAATLLPLYADASRPEDKLAELSRVIEAELPLTVCLLGMGADMHTASIFPEADLLSEAFLPDAATLLPMRAPGAPEPRITLSARVIKGAMNLHVVITGDEKRAALEVAQKLNNPLLAPISAMLPNASVHWAA